MSDLACSAICSALSYVRVNPSACQSTCQKVTGGAPAEGAAACGDEKTEGKGEEIGIGEGRQDGGVPQIDAGTVATGPAPVCEDGATQVCYTGPAGTLDIGICQVGKQVCTNGEWGTCEGEVTPQNELLCNGLDDNCDGVTDITIKYFPGENQETAFSSIIEQEEGAYILAGKKGGPARTNEYEGWAIRLDQSFDEGWERTFNQGENDSIFRIQSAGNGFALEGVSYSISRGFPVTNNWIVYTDNQGRELWRVNFDVHSGLHSFAAGPTHDGGIILVRVKELGEGCGFILHKYDRSGAEQWNRTHGTCVYDIHSIQQTPDDGFIIAGTGSTNTIYPVLLTTDALGNGGADYMFDEHVNRVTTAFQQTRDSGFILAGTREEPDGNAWIIKTSLNFDISWLRTYNLGDDNATVTFIQQTQDGGFVLGTQQLLLKINDSGNEEWRKPFAGCNAMAGLQTRNGSFLLAGNTGAHYTNLVTACLVNICNE